MGLASLLLIVAAALGQEPAAPDPLAEARALLAEARAASSASDHARLRANVEAGVELLTTATIDDVNAVGRLLEQLADLGAQVAPRAVLEAREWLLVAAEGMLEPDDPILCAVWGRAAQARSIVGDLAGARELLEKTVELAERVLEPSDANLGGARLSLGTTYAQLGEQERALDLLERAREESSPHFPAEHALMIAIRANSGRMHMELGRYEKARDMDEELLALLERITSEGDPRLAAVRNNLALTLQRLGETERPRELLEQVLAYRERTLPEDHRHVAGTRINLAIVYMNQGDVEESRGLLELAVASLEQSLPPDHPELSTARSQLGNALRQLGHLERAREVIERSIDALERTRSHDDMHLAEARGALASLLLVRHDYAGARALLEPIQLLYERTRPGTDDSHRIRSNLAVARAGTGDYAGARALLERVVAARERSLEPGHRDLVTARTHLASLLFLTGDHDAALELQRAALEDLRGAGRPPEDPQVLLVRQNLGVSLRDAGDLAGAAATLEDVLATRLRLLGDDHPQVALTTSSLANTRLALGDLERARELFERALAARLRLMPAGHPFVDRTRSRLVWTLLGLQDDEALAEHAQPLVDGARKRLNEALVLAPREAREVARDESARIEDVMHIAARSGADPALARDAFELIETQRHVSTAALARTNVEGVVLADLRDEALRLRTELNEAVAGAAETVDAVSISALVFERDRVEAEIRRSLLAGTGQVAEVDLDALAGTLEPGDVAVGYRRYFRITVDPRTPHVQSGEDAYLAHVVRADGSLTRIELGPAETIDARIGAWREAIGEPFGPARGIAGAVPASADSEAAEEAGRELRAALLDPVLAVLREAELETLALCLDDALFLLPFDALPMEDGSVGDRYRLRLDVSFARRLAPHAALDTDPVLVALGGVRFDTADDPGAVADRAHAFAPLPGTEREVRDLAALFRETFDRDASLLTADGATKSALHAAAPRARYLHLATHGYFADVPPAPRVTGLRGAPPSTPYAAAGARSLAPMTLCGLALAGANDATASLGRAPGILTAEELAGLDLARCELAVLSACETNVGIRSAGQGVQSLQAAVHAAGARAAITSLWKVDDAMTRRVMELFYTYLWVEELSTAEALWRAKQGLRAEGAAVRDWAAWVLSGDPR